MTIDPLAERGFGSTPEAAAVYDSGRPAYPDGVAKQLAGEFGLDRKSRLLDLAAGTGQLSRLFVPIVGSVVAVEPSAAMRDLLAKRLPTVEVLAGRAEQLPLADGSVDAAVVGNAFHWFEGDDAVRELARVLRPGGGLAVLWNNGLETDPPWPERVVELIVELRARALPDERNSLTGRWRAALDRAGEQFEPLRYTETRHERPLDRDAYVAGVASFSFVASLPDRERESVLAEVRDLAPNNCVLKMQTECYRTRRRPLRPQARPRPRS